MRGVVVRQYGQVLPSGQNLCQALKLRDRLRLLPRLAGLSILSTMIHLLRERETARRHRQGQVLSETLPVGAAPVGHDANGLQWDSLPGVQAPSPEPVRPGAVQGQGAPPVQEAVMQIRGVLLVLRQQEEGVVVECVLRPSGVDQGVPSPDTGRRAIFVVQVPMVWWG